MSEKFPNARAALIEIRDKKTKRLQNGEHNRELFHDVESINDYLKESKTTVDLFKKLDEASPKFATSVYDLADEAIVAAGEYRLARKHLGDPLEKLEKAKDNFKRGIAFSKRSSAGEASRTAFENIFTERTLRIITILKNSGELSVAKTVQSEALKLLDNPELREALPADKN